MRSVDRLYKSFNKLFEHIENNIIESKKEKGEVINLLSDLENCIQLNEMLIEEMEKQIKDFKEEREWRIKYKTLC